MTDRELLELLLNKVTEMEINIATKQDVQGLKDNIADINYKVDAVYEQTAGLTEFKTEVTKALGRHELDIHLLKKLAAQ